MRAVNRSLRNAMGRRIALTASARRELAQRQQELNEALARRRADRGPAAQAGAGVVVEPGGADDPRADSRLAGLIADVEGLLRRVEPVYPATARAIGAVGNVTVEFTVAEDAARASEDRPEPTLAPVEGEEAGEGDEAAPPAPPP